MKRKFKIVKFENQTRELLISPPYEVKVNLASSSWRSVFGCILYHLFAPFWIIVSKLLKLKIYFGRPELDIEWITKSENTRKSNKILSKKI
jgi:hypothetical protein